MIIVAFKDVAADKFNIPQFTDNEATACRIIYSQVKEVVKKGDITSLDQLNDLVLYKLGDFDEKTGIVADLKEIIKVCDLVKKVKKESKDEDIQTK